MSDKHTTCPECATTYKVSVVQLTAAQGMVCCPKCDFTFNAISHIILNLAEDDISISGKHEQLKNKLIPNKTEYQYNIDSNIVDIFDRKVTQSNIDLTTYLNNLNYFSPEPVTALPTLNLASVNVQGQEKKYSTTYYTIWALINISLVVIFVMQILIFNPKFVNNSAIINTAYIKVCNLFKCEALNEQYNLIDVYDQHIKSINNHQTQISGMLLNYNEHSLIVPRLKLSLYQKGRLIYERILSPEEYLISSLTSVERIPTNSPFHFKILLPLNNKSFDDYKIEILKP